MPCSLLVHFGSIMWCDITEGGIVFQQLFLGIIYHVHCSIQKSSSLEIWWHVNNEQSCYCVGLHTQFKLLQCTPEANASITKTFKRFYWLSVHDNQLYNFLSLKLWVIWNHTNQNHNKISAFHIYRLGPVAYQFNHTGPYSNCMLNTSLHIVFQTLFCGSWP